jgi:sulfur-oxidizing protein SoxY
MPVFIPVVPSSIQQCCSLLLALLFAFVSGFASAEEPAALPTEGVDPEQVWVSLKQQAFGERTLTEDVEVIRLVAPPRSEDSANTPITIELPNQVLAGAEQLSRILLFIDMNPEPLALEVRGGVGGLPAKISTRVRVESYTHIHAVAERVNGELFLASQFVKAAGGCSAPPQIKADGRQGEMRFRAAMGQPVQAQVSIRHPNHSGLQRDPYTHDWIPPNFIRSIAVSHRGQLVLHAKTGISLSQNPTLSFGLPENVSAAELLVDAMDSQGELYSEEWQQTPEER